MKHVVHLFNEARCFGPTKAFYSCKYRTNHELQLKKVLLGLKHLVSLYNYTMCSMLENPCPYSISRRGNESLFHHCARYGRPDSHSGTYMPRT